MQPAQQQCHAACLPLKKVIMLGHEAEYIVVWIFINLV
jgi:hypothetical protein